MLCDTSTILPSIIFALGADHLLVRTEFAHAAQLKRVGDEHGIDLYRITIMFLG